ncbi:MAG TPA: serine/threonine-protein kinase [Myxococcales bacterium]|nr:serine/threonine-protein kinase [Myxococcales bacterium]
MSFQFMEILPGVGTRNIAAPGVESKALPSCYRRLSVAAAAKLGRYTLLGKIASGGMAEVFLARQEGPKGFSKTVVVKRILPAFASKPEFVRMFLDEARLAALINHANVSAIYELGEEKKGETYFIAMEYIDGCDLRRVVAKAIGEGSRLPPALCGKVIADAAAGLHHAHELRGQGDEPLAIVHRDVSPENILVTYGGQVKVVDFGIAKAAHLESKTRTGQIKGKISYLSPEQLLGKEVDRRADVWALGVTLYWACSGQKPFAGKTEAEVLQQILNVEPPPLKKILPGAPKALERILERALEKDPDDRYSTARALQDDIEGWLAESTPRVTAASLADRMNALFPPKRDPDRQLKNAILAGELPKAKKGAKGRGKKKGSDFDVDLGVPDFSFELAPPDESLDLDIVADEPLAPGPTSLDVDLREASLLRRGTRTALRMASIFLGGYALGLVVWFAVQHQGQLAPFGAWAEALARDLAAPGGAGRHVPMLASTSAVVLAAVGALVWVRRPKTAPKARKARSRSK